VSTAKEKLLRLLNSNSEQLKATRARPPVFPIVVANYAARLAGEQLGRAITDPKVLSSVLFYCYQRFDYDLIMVFTDVLVEAEAMGSTVEILPDEPPMLLQPAGETARLADPERDCRLPLILNATRRLKALTGDRVFILVSLKGPFTLASLLCGPELFLESLVNKPATADHYLRLATQNQLRYLRAIVASGGVPFIGDPMASGSIISPEQFRQFALPFLQELIAAIHSLGLWTGLHICGDTVRLLELMVQTGADILSIDDLNINLNAVRKWLGPETVIMGNVSTALLENGTPASVRQAAEQCLIGGMPKLLLASACDVPVGTPPENISALVSAAREWQWS
jgi:uroporphyrinogen decarboxylase